MNTPLALSPRQFFYFLFILFTSPLLIAANPIVRGTTRLNRDTSGLSTAQKAYDVLEKHCASCHGGNGHAEGNFGYVLDFEKLISKGQVVPGNLKDSYLYERAAVTKDMPPKKITKLTDEEGKILADWILAGAPLLEPTDPSALSPADSLAVLHTVVTDLESLPSSKERKLSRYLTLHPIYNTLLRRKLSATEIKQKLLEYQNALSKLLNSLSTTTRVTPVTVVGNTPYLFRFNLENYNWDAETWEKIIKKNPFFIQYNNFDQRKANSFTGTSQPIVHADWFASVVSIPPLYHDILKLPKTDIALENSLALDIEGDISTFKVHRAGFVESGVSQNNRVIERHSLKQMPGAYWKSYDFTDNKGTNNILDFPLGPVGFAQNFNTAAGEIIWNLPNGMQAYFLVQYKRDHGRFIGERIDTAVTTIVSDPSRPDKLVINGLSCMGCHAEGMRRHKGDVIRHHVSTNNPSIFGTVSKLYPPDNEFNEFLKSDAERFLVAQEKTGVVPKSQDPINHLVQYFEEPLDLVALAYDLQITPERLTQVIKQSEKLQLAIGYLTSPGKSIKRETLVGQFQEILNELSKYNENNEEIFR